MSHGGESWISVLDLAGQSNHAAAEQVAHGDRIFKRIREHAQVCGSPMFSRLGTKVRPVREFDDDSRAYRYGYGRIPIAGNLDDWSNRVSAWRPGDEFNQNNRRLYSGKGYVSIEGRYSDDASVFRPVQPRFGDSVLLAALSGESFVSQTPDGHREEGVPIETWDAGHGWSRGFSDKHREVVGLLGLMLDLDVKPGAATSTEHALEALDRAEIPVAFVCQSSDSGGLHAAVIFERLYVPDEYHDLGLCARAFHARISKSTGLRFDSFGHLKAIRLPGGVRMCGVTTNGMFFNRARLLREDWDLCQHPEGLLTSEFDEVREKSVRSGSVAGGYRPQVRRTIDEGDAVDSVLLNIGQGYTIESIDGGAELYRLKVCPGCADSSGNPHVSQGGYLRCWRSSCVHDLRKCKHAGCGGEALSESEHICSSCSKGTGTTPNEWLAQFGTRIRIAFLDQWRTALAGLRGHAKPIDPMARTEQGISDDMKTAASKTKEINLPSYVEPNTGMETILREVSLGHRTHAAISQRVTLRELVEYSAKNSGQKIPWYGVRDDRQSLIEQLQIDPVALSECSVVRPLKEDLERHANLPKNRKDKTPEPARSYVIPPAIGGVVRFMKRQNSDIHPQDIVDLRGKPLTLHRNRPISVRSFRCTQWEWVALHSYHGVNPCSDCPAKALCNATPGHYLHDTREAIGELAGASAVFVGDTALSTVPDIFDEGRHRFIFVNPLEPNLGRRSSFDCSPSLFLTHENSLAEWLLKQDGDTSIELHEFSSKWKAIGEIERAGDRLVDALRARDSKEVELLCPTAARFGDFLDGMMKACTNAFDMTLPHREAASGLRTWIKRRRRVPAFVAARLALSVVASIRRWINGEGLKSMDVSADIRNDVYSLLENGDISHECLDAIRAGWSAPARSWEKVKEGAMLPVAFTGWCLKAARASLDRGGVHLRQLSVVERRKHASKLKAVRELFGALAPSEPRIRVCWTSMDAVRLWNAGVVSSISNAPLPRLVLDQIGHVQHLVSHELIRSEQSPLLFDHAGPAARRHQEVLVPSPKGLQRSWCLPTTAVTKAGPQQIVGRQTSRAAVLDAIGQANRDGFSVAVWLPSPSKTGEMMSIVEQRAAAFDAYLGNDRGRDSDRLSIEGLKFSALVRGVDSSFASGDGFDVVIDLGTTPGLETLGAMGAELRTLLQLPDQDFSEEWVGYDMTPQIPIEGRRNIRPIPMSVEGQALFEWFEWRGWGGTVLGSQSLGFSGRHRLGAVERQVEYLVPNPAGFAARAFGFGEHSFLSCIGDPARALSLDQALEGLQVSGLPSEARQASLALLRLSAKDQARYAGEGARVASCEVLRLCASLMIAEDVDAPDHPWNSSGEPSPTSIQVSTYSGGLGTYLPMGEGLPELFRKMRTRAERIVNRSLSEGVPTPGRSLEERLRNLCRCMSVILEPIAASGAFIPPLPFLEPLWLRQVSEWPGDDTSGLFLDCQPRAPQ